MCPNPVRFTWRTTGERFCFQRLASLASALQIGAVPLQFDGLIRWVTRLTQAIGVPMAKPKVSDADLMLRAFATLKYYDKGDAIPDDIRTHLECYVLVAESKGYSLDDSMAA